MSFGSNLSFYRKQAGLTQQQLSERLNVSPQAISKWENDLAEPDLLTVGRLAEIYNVTIDQLLSKESEPTVQPADSTPQPVISAAVTAPTAPRAKQKKKKKKLLPIILTSVIALLLIAGVLCYLFFVQFNIFRKAVVTKISIGMRDQEVVELLGEPDIKEIDCDLAFSSLLYMGVAYDECWYYIENNPAEKLGEQRTKVYENEPVVWDTLYSEEEIGRFIEICFKDGKVISVRYNSNKLDDIADNLDFELAVEKVEHTVKEEYQGQGTAWDVSYAGVITIHYENNCYAQYAVSGLRPQKSTDKEIVWTDVWGATVTVSVANPK